MKIEMMSIAREALPDYPVDDNFPASAGELAPLEIDLCSEQDSVHAFCLSRSGVQQGVVYLDLPGSRRALLEEA